ncbi:serine hydrolase domain-containing protein [Olleya sp. Hel_I_94]|uniref:serine hydrolase domain-containing protein n=1 Tax=Olleya sp. Hel_I_94 TaxID=1250001 RepID=UPI00119D1579|nr:serine hydrolase domain-containing protein [Olleya sp. Hel_I_94]TVZ46795.1 CubicO group peptidase (beta-lactamase class C family) [Olleya sp. Hel_I_94]
MNQSKYLVILIVFCIIPKIGCAQNLETKIDKLYKVEANEPGFSIAVFKKDQILFQKQYGTTNLDYNIPISSKTVFDIASISKQFTAAAILLLEEEGKLNIKEPAYKYIDKLPRYKKGNPTIEQLLNQTSGIKEADPYFGVIDLWFNDYIDQQQMINIITKVSDLRFKPGEYFYYSNANYILLASIIEKASGETYSNYLQKNIFNPLNMDNTSIKDNIYKSIKNRAIGYIEDDGQYYKTHFHAVKFVGDGQILTNPDDMHKWHLNLRNATIGSPELWKKMHTKATLNNGKKINFGLGVEFETYNGHEAVGFDGMSAGGFVSKYLYFPTLEIAFFTTQNKFEDEFRDTFFDFVDLYVTPNLKNETLDETYNFITLSNKQLKQYEGHYLYYYNDDDKKANSIQVKNDKLIAYTLDGDKIAELKPIGNNEFIFLMGNSKALVKFNLEKRNTYFTYNEFNNDKPWVFNQFKPYAHSEKELSQFEGEYYNTDFQIAKKICLDNGSLYLYYKNGAYKTELTSISKNLLEISISPIAFERNEKNEITSFTLMGIQFEKL